MTTFLPVPPSGFGFYHLVRSTNHTRPSHSPHRLHMMPGLLELQCKPIVYGPRCVARTPTRSKEHCVLSAVISNALGLFSDWTPCDRTLRMLDAEILSVVSVHVDVFPNENTTQSCTLLDQSLYTIILTTKCAVMEDTNMTLSLAFFRTTTSRG